MMALAIVRTRVVSLNTKGDGWNVNNAGGGAGVPVDSAGFVCFGSGGSAICVCLVEYGIETARQP